MNLACSSTAKNLMIQAYFSLSYAATVRYTRLSNVVSESLLKYQLTACAVSSLIQPMMQTEHGSFKQLMPFVLIGFSSCMAETSQRVKFISALILGIGYLIPSIKINLISSDKKNIEGQPLIPLEPIVEAEKRSLKELSIESEEKVTQLLQNYGELAYPRGMIKLVLRDALRTSQQVDQGCILGELLAIQLQEFPIAEFKVDGAAIILCGIRELFFPSKVQDLLNQKEISSILNLGAMNGYYLPEDLSNPELLPPILNVFADDDPKSEWPLDQLAVLTDQLVQQAKKENKTVIIHCKEGKSRSVSVLIAYLILKGTFDSVDMCLDRIQQQRAIARPNSGFMEKLQSFAERVSEVRKKPIMTRPTHELIVEVNQLCQTQY